MVSQRIIIYRSKMLLLSLVSLVFFHGCSRQSSSTDSPDTVCFNNKCFIVEVARTKSELMRGLQLRDSLDKDKGMLFIFPSTQRQSFWMKDTFIPLDIIWLDRRKKIVFIIPNILPCETERCPVYTPDSDASYVLEVNAGVAAEFGLRVGDQAVF